MRIVISDRPIEIHEEDVLGRSPFAKSIADQIINAPDRGSLRIGIYGGWGEGKTSILRLIATELEKNGHVCIWVTPWVFSNREEILGYLIREITNKLGIDTSSSNFATKGAELIKDFRRASGSDIKLKLVDSLIGLTLEKLINKKASEQGQLIIATIDEQLRDRKLIIIVDDLDRVRPELVPDLLLTLREALDYPNYFYIMALSPEVLEQGLKDVHQGWGEPRQFLEKIIELPKYVPAPSPQERNEYAKALINSFGAKISKEAVEDIAPFLSTNPRKLKLYLRYIASLYGVFSRFHDEEVDWRTLYLCLLLRFEFPKESRLLIEDEEILDNIETSYIKKVVSFRPKSGQADEAENVPEIKYAPQSVSDKERFLSICRAIRDRGYLYKGKYRLPRLMTLSDIPPVLTFKEIETLLDSLKDVKSNLLKKEVIDRLEAYGGFNNKTGAALVEGIIDIRQNLLSYSVDLEIESELINGLQPVGLLTDILKVISVELGGFSNSILSIDSWSTIFKHCASWAHFETFEYYKSLRQKERELLKDIVTSMPKTMQFEIIGSRELDTEFTFDKKSEEFTILIKEILSIIEKNASDSFIDAFEAPNGIESFWAIDMYSKWKFSLFSKQSLFHTDPEYRKKLKEISAKSNENIGIQRNFITYFRMLYHGGYGSGGSFPREECQALLKDPDLLNLVWSASISRPLNPRTAGGLYRDRESLIKQGVPEEILKTPKWWQRLDEIGFFKKPE
jgi:hypothetical protein